MKVQLMKKSKCEVYGCEVVWLMISMSCRLWLLTKRKKQEKVIIGGGGGGENWERFDGELQELEKNEG